MKKQLQIIATLVCISIATISNSQTISFATIFSSGYDNPIAIAHANDSRLFVVQKTGAIFICDSLGVRNPVPFLNISNLISTISGEQGLLGMVFHPNYASNGYFYVNYTDVNGNTRIDRITRNQGDINLADSSTRFNIITIAQPAANHNAGTLKFGPDGYLYIAMGDGSPPFTSQDPLDLLGKMVRIDVNNASPYSVPPTNPYVGNASYAPEIWATGLRNPWKFSFDRITGDMWIGDVGDNIEEINFKLAGSAPGENYGWPCHQGLNTTYYTTQSCTPPLTGNVVAPIYNYPYVATPPTTISPCAVIGGYRYRSAKHNSLFGTYFFADWCSGLVRTITGTPGNWTVADNTHTGYYYAITSFAEDRNGDLYIVMASHGAIHKLDVSNSCAPVAYIFGNDTAALPVTLQALSYPGLQYQWQLDGNNVIGAVQSTYTPNTQGLYTIVVTQPSGSCSTTSTQVFVQNLKPTVVTNDPAAVCSPATVDLTLPAVTGGSTVGLVYAYFTDSAATLPYPTPTTTAVAGAYYIVGTTGLGYSDTTLVTVTINPIPTVLATNPAAGCSPATVDLTLPSVTVGSIVGLTFTYFTDPAATISHPTPTTATTGTYYIVGTTGGCSDTTSVTVTIDPIPTITQNGSELTSSAITGNQWYLDGSVINGATNQTYTVTQNGNYTVIANSNTCSSLAINITSTSIQLSNNTVTLSVYPNPSDGNFTVSFYAPTKSIYRVEVRTILGALVFKDVLSDYSGNYSKSFNVLEYGKGVYTISLISANSETLKEIVVY